MEREKMIEEMTTFLKCCNHLCHECDRAKQLSSVHGCIVFSISKTLYNAGYRKIPDGAVVLTKEKYEKLKNKSPFAVIKYDEDKMKEIAKEAAKNIVLEFTEKGKDKICKETAKEILNMGEKLYEMSYHKSNAMPRLIEWIKVEYGVEVEE